MRASGIVPVARVAAILTCLLFLALPARGQGWPSGKQDPDGTTVADWKAALPEFFQPQGERLASPADIPDVFGPGAVLRVGNVYQKITNYGFIGNEGPNLSSDPGGQWPGASGIEYLFGISFGVAGVNPQATDPTAIRRVSYRLEWRPPTLDKVDRIYRSYDGIINGTRFVDDDKSSDLKGRNGAPNIDEDFLDGRDNDGDGKIDEDFGALGQQEFTCLMRDDTREALNATFNEKHVPLGVELRQAAWAYSIPGFSDFNVIEYTVFNRSGHTLDSLCLGWRVDMDAGPVAQSNYFSDDLDLPGFPSGDFIQITTLNDRRLQDSTMRGVNDNGTNPRDVRPDSALCPRFHVRINGFSIGDDNGDEGQTKGIPSFLLVNHTIDPLGISAPSRVGFSSFRSYTGGTPYIQGGAPIVDQQRFELMVGTKPNGINDETGFIDFPPSDQRGDYAQWCAVGPFRNIVDGASVHATVAFAVETGKYEDMFKFPQDYNRYQAGVIPWAVLKDAYPPLENALAIQVAYEGIWADRPDLYDPSRPTEWPFLTNGHGRETSLIAAPGTGAFEAKPDCHDFLARTVSDRIYDWFDYDCDYCTGAYDSRKGRGMFHVTWNVGAPPPNPNVNVAATYNYSANPDPQRILPAGDSQVTLAWDNLSEVTADPKTGVFDFRGFKVWKAANWTRPVGSAGPGDDDWSLLGEFREFNYYNSTDSVWIAANFDTLVGSSTCPQLFIPNYFDPATHSFVGPKTVPICLRRYDIWDRQSGIIIRPAPNVACEAGSGSDGCHQDVGCILGSTNCQAAKAQELRDHYPIGRYQLVDREVKDGFVYFYSITAFDSTGGGSPELGGRRSAVEAEGVVPQYSASKARGNVWVVPNPYRGYAELARRPSSWDLTPNASDPTGTHIDFFGLPSGRWTIKIFTVSGDLVAELHSTDPVNESLRGPVVGSDGQSHPGYNAQQDNPEDGQARWNLISRNGQDVVSGIYLFMVDSAKGTQRGRFVVIR